MQYHHHGYVARDPLVKEAAGTGLDCSEDFPDTMDVLIVGAGPAGIIQAAQLSHYPGIHTRIIDSRPGRLEVGRADGLWARSSETFQAFGFYDRINAESHRLVDVHFWGPDPEDPTKIMRGVRAEDPPSGVSEFPFLIVNQARVIDCFAEYAERGPARITPDFGYEFLELEVQEGEEHPVQVRLRDPQGQERTVRAKYVVGCDGSRSRVRDGTGIEVVRDPSAHAWSVMDVLLETDFPDIHQKCGIQSDKDGTILLIPRVGGFLARFYVSLGSIDDVPPAEVGRRNPRVFIAGDACHTHSAKAGQGMNVSMQDGWNLAWKLGQVLEGRSDASRLAAGVPIGKRFESAAVRRVADTSPRQLGHLFEADGRWRLYAFADEDRTAVRELADWLADSPDSPVRRFTPEGADLNSVFDAKVVYQQPYQEVELADVPALFLPKMGRHQLTDKEEVFAADPADDIFEARGNDRGGALIIQRPDMYVAHVLPLSAREEITAFFEQSMASASV